MPAPIHGIEDFSEKMKAIGDKKTIKRIVNSSMRQAMNIVRDAARQRARRLDNPNTPERVWREIMVQNGKSRKSGAFVMRVGVRGGAKIPYTNNAQNKRSGKAGKSYVGDGRVFYWRFLEFGTSRQPATPFMRPALHENIQPVTDKFVQVFRLQLTAVLGVVR
ncbi:HK97-gp10 family putative phage morphogenesis protein [Acinetobacter colistiniresistens]|uniref:HK97-gp10 family putative phage morphogenesis protein n=1 Tax=Acinetobacter colistiniresistens TaxID=280145 RepID=UPI001250C433|nr:HK97-gp10 family putative phage morphogenesis protein [Acinetobacter colistiniresistens]